MPSVFGGGGRKTWIIKVFWSEKWRDELVCSKMIVIVACEKVLDHTYITERKVLVGTYTKLDANGKM
jgi:hypothetical protein